MGAHDLVGAAILRELEARAKLVRALLDQAQSLSEREVLAAGDRIADMRREAEGNLACLEQVGREFDSSSTAVGGSTFDVTMRKNATVMQGYTERLRDGMVRQRPSTLAVTEVAKKISAFVSGVERVSVELRMLTLNARLEAARWGSQGAAFATVASSMRELTHEVAKANEQIGDLASELSGIASRVAESETMMEKLSVELTADVALQMAALTAAYEETRRASSEAVSGGIERGQKLINHSNSVLSNLQFQDRMSQVLREAESVVVGAQTVTAELLATSSCGAVGDVSAAIDTVLGRATNASIRLSGESELASSDAGLASGEVELF